MTDNALAFSTLMIFAAFLLGLKLGLSLIDRAIKKEALKQKIVNSLIKKEDLT